MKKICINCLLVTLIIFLEIHGQSLPVAYAGEVGQVRTETGVGFYEESTSDNPKETNRVTPSKPIKRKYPDTGERIRKRFMIGGLFLIVLAIIFFWLKRKRKE